MRLLTFLADDAPRAGILMDDGVHPLAVGVTVLDVVRAGLPVDPARWLPATPAPVIAFDECSLLAPLQPPTIRDFVAFEEHVEGVRRGIVGKESIPAAWYEAPTFYFGNPHGVIGSGEEISRPSGCAELDFELEVGIVIGRSGSNVTPIEGLDHVFGYTIFNDWSARDLQRREMRVGLGPAKGKDFGSTLGPVLVTADEFTLYMDDEGFLGLAMSVSVNGEIIGSDMLSNMGWPISDLVAYASRDTWIHPGDLLGSGTCGNGGCLAELWGRGVTGTPPPLQAGDLVTMTVEGIGTISNRVVDGMPVPIIPPARPRPRNRPSNRPPNQTGPDGAE